MKIYMYLYLAIFIIISIIGLQGQTLVKNENPSQNLEQKWNWGLKQLDEDGYWMGYSFEKMMNKNSHIGCFSDDVDGFPTLEEILTHSGSKLLKQGSSINSYRHHKHFSYCDSDSGEKVFKKIGVLCRFNRAKKITEVLISNLSLPVDLNNLSLVWLGAASPDESLELLRSLYKQTDALEAKKEMITGISLHPPNKAINDFLKSVIYSHAANQLRKSAVFWLGLQELKETPDLLLEIIEKDKSREVRKEAVFALSLQDSENATDKLIEVARHNKEMAIRKTAIFWLGQKASNKSVEFLEETVYSEEETELQKQAVFALSQLEGNGSIAKLIKVAKTHPNMKVRKNAIFWLGQSEDERALNAIVDFLKSE